MKKENYSRILPVTPWTASSMWPFAEAKPLLVLIVSLSLFGFGEGMLVVSRLGSTPWTVLSQGIARISGGELGTITLMISAVVMLGWIPLRLKPGLGTVLNMLLIAGGLGVFVHFVAVPESLAARVALCVGGIMLIGVSSAFYLTCHTGAGPRDGLMVGLCQASGWRIGSVRTAIEAVVCLIGWLLGGTVGIGTLLFAFGVGWVVQISLKLLARCFQAA